jgi:predicted nucleotidyltransferase
MMISTDLERELALKLLKDFTKDYNPGNIAKEVKKTRVGTFKSLKSLEMKGIVIGRTLGKARFYKYNLESPFARKTAELLLMDEANQYQMWLNEIKELFPHIKIAILFGSAVKNKNTSKDIDILLVYSSENNNIINSTLKSKNEMLIKKIHLLKQTKQDIARNIRKKDAVILDTIRTGIVLFGYQELTELIYDTIKTQS